jgi:hypothetical protein
MHTLFSSWQAVGRVGVVGALGYIALLIMLRVSGKRTIAKMNVFDASSRSKRGTGAVVSSLPQ